MSQTAKHKIPESKKPMILKQVQKRLLSSNSVPRRRIISDLCGVEASVANPSNFGALGLSVRALVSGHGFPLAVAKQASGATPCGIAEVLQAYAAVYQNVYPRARGMRDAKRILAALRLSENSQVVDDGNEVAFEERDRSVMLHMDAAVALVEDQDVKKAVELWERRLLEYPFDLLALRVLQETLIRTGDVRGGLECVQKVISVWKKEHEGYGYLIALQANGLVENGAVEMAEEICGQALTLEPDAGVAVVAAAHGFLNSYRFRECKRLLRELEHSFTNTDAPNSSFCADQLFHHTLASLEAAKVGPSQVEVDRLLDQKESSWDLGGMCLWRFKTQGIDDETMKALQNRALDSRSIFTKIFMKDSYKSSQNVTDRFRILYDHAFPLGDLQYDDMDDVFPLVHLQKIMVLLGAHEMEQAEKYLQKMTEGSKTESIQAAAFPVCKALIQFEKGNACEAFELLQESRNKWHLISGRRQIFLLLDIFAARVLLEVAGIGIPKVFESESLEEKELGERKGEQIFWLNKCREQMSLLCARNSLSPIAWDWNAHILREIGMAGDAALCRQRAQELGLKQGGFHET